MAKVLIVGGGASGLVAGIVAARQGAKVTILEKLGRVGKKILTTGNGRCNISNRYCSVDQLHGDESGFVKSALQRFSVEDTIQFFEELGVHIKEESLGKLYPNSDQAASVLDVLRYEVERLKIDVQCDSKVTKIERRKKDFVIHCNEDKKYYAQKVIIATGGKAAPKLGCDGDGYHLLKEYGHCTSPLFPALVQIKLLSDYLKRVKGVKFMGTVSALVESEIMRVQQGEILYTDYGISGPPLLQLSRVIGDGLRQNKHVTLKVDMMDRYTNEELDQMLLKRATDMPFKTMEDSLIGLINKRLIIPYLSLAEIDKGKQVSQFTKAERLRLVSILKGLSLEVSGTKSWNEAQVTAGGILTKDIDRETMESKLIKGLYIVGELQDVDGDCGGFNLQWAWSSGYVAGDEASKK